MTGCVLTSNLATTSASILYVSSTATITHTMITNSAFSLNSATNSDGGLFYMSGITSNEITFDN